MDLYEIVLYCNLTIKKFPSIIPYNGDVLMNRRLIKWLFFTVGDRFVLMSACVIKINRKCKMQDRWLMVTGKWYRQLTIGVQWWTRNIGNKEMFIYIVYQ